MEVQSAEKRVKTSYQESTENADNLLEEAESILTRYQNKSEKTRSFVILYLLLGVFLGSAAMGMWAETATYSHLAFGTATIVGLSIVRLLH